MSLFNAVGCVIFAGGALVALAAFFGKTRREDTSHLDGR